VQSIQKIDRGNKAAGELMDKIINIKERRQE
jgi:hypothetical protein